jgi:YVTN family beta-propeller protein
MMTNWVRVAFGAAGCGLVVGVVAAQQAPVEKPGGHIDLPSSKQIVGVVPGDPQRLNSLPVAMAVSPDGRYVVTVNGGYGSYESKYDQSLAVMDTQTGKVVDYPDERTLGRSGQVLFSGLAFSADGKKLYGSIVSATDPEGKKDDDTGSGIQVYGFADGKITREKGIRIPLQKLAAGKTTKLVGGVDGGMGLPYPAGIAVVDAAPGPTHRDETAMNGAHTLLLVADNLSDDVLLMDAASGAIGKRFDVSNSNTVPGTYPDSVAVAKDGKRAFVGLWNSSEVVELDLVSSKVARKLALLKADSDVKPSSHPTALEMSPDGKTLYVALGNRDAVAAVDLSDGGFKLKGYFDTRLPGQSFYGALPEALAMNADGSRLYVANLGSDAVAVIDTKKLTEGAVEKGMVEPIGFIPTEWMPMGVAFSGGKILIASGKGTGTGPNNFPQRQIPGAKGGRPAGPSSYIATLLHGSLAVVDAKTAESSLKSLTAEVLEDNRMKAAEEKIQWAAEVIAKASATTKTEADSSASPRNDKQKNEAGSSASPRNDKQKNEAGSSASPRNDKQKNEAGSSASPRNDKQKNEAGSSASPRNDNQKNEADSSASLRNDKQGPIKHVIYIIKENRTYDQIFGDLKKDGKPVGNGDASLTMYGADITPNLHKLALQFGVLDNFYDSGEVSGDGHVWSNAAINSDYNERTWQVNYRGSQRGYDYEGVVSQGIPLEQHIPDVAEPGTGYMWGNAEQHGKTHYNFGEFIASTFCTDKGRSIAQKDSQMGPLLEGQTCSRSQVKMGEKLPEVWGAEVSKWPWAIPLLAANHATKPELVGHFAEEDPDFNLQVPDQIRVNVFVRHLDGWIADMRAGKDTMPNFITMRLGNDHTAGTTPGGPTPKASVSDNDLAVGRIVEAVSHSEFWDSTAICVLEDDAQNGADHVDAHRSIALLISKYAPRAASGEPFVDSRFYSTVSMVRTMETLLGLPPMNNNDAFSSLIGSLFTGAGNQPAYTIDASNRENGLIYTANKANAPGARASAKMDFRHEDRAPVEKLNVILWQDAMGSQPVPAMLLQKRKAKKDADDD